MDRVLISRLLTPAVNESLINWTPSDEKGLPPEVMMPRPTLTYGVRPVTDEDEASMIVGVQFLIGNNVVAAHRFDRPLSLGSSFLGKTTANTQQISGHVSNDGKQVNILSGQGSCTVGYPMPCCLVAKENLGRPPQWLMRLFVRRAIAAASARRSSLLGEQEVANVHLPDAIVDSIALLSALPVVEDPPRREGHLSFAHTHKKWRRLTRDGRHRLTQADHQRDNAAVGSSFYKPILCTPCIKENNGVMHTPCGHINHYWVSVSDAIAEKMKGCEWQLRLDQVSTELEERTAANQTRIKECESGRDCKVRLYGNVKLTSSNRKFFMR